ncbi:MAG: hypothetical protein E5W74_28345 [Mesorhizobium sp.]|uniref:hypothetical protein n=1 Tax=Mesorhizobium sp. TaxID=1871066 RepID=UPI001203810A|nr:hypothetical protein [Mesorhizobium sp.]TIT06811.1 MAG: hypothetical protein E5W74_28345 [Mesorhizobium sp.]
MKLFVTKRAPHLGTPGTPFDMTLSQAAYERLRGHLVPQATVVDPPPSHIEIEDRVDIVKAVRRGKRK